MRTILKITALLFFSLQLQAQQKTIVGVISDENGLPLPGVNITKKGTSNRTQTDFDGLYKISVNTGDVLNYSFIGYQSVDKIVEDSILTISFSMELDVEAIDEVVVTALGIKTISKSVSSSRTRKKTRKLNKRTNVSTKKVLKQNNSNVVNSLSGKVSGVQVTNNFGSIGSSSRIVLRGNSSITGNNQPLFVVDGVPLCNSNYGNVAENENMAISNLNHDDIKSISVIKGPNAAALYGVRAANGVVVVQTKKGNYKLSKAEKAVIKSQNKQQQNQDQDQDQDQDVYVEIVENNFEIAKMQPLSTFSIDVDKASYSNIRRMINNGQKISSDAVKIEEMVNYFDYNYPQPTNEHPFSINTELAVTPWNAKTQIVKIGLQGKSYKNEALPASNLTFLIDVSGSMGSQNKLPLLKEAFKLLVNQLREKDKVSIVVYAGAAGVVLEPTSGNNKEKIIKALNNLESGGSTAGGEGIELAYKFAEKNFKKKGNNRVILATDGDFNVGISSDKDMKSLIEEKRKSGVFLSVLGFGYGNYQDSKLEILADKGNGNHAYIDTMQEAQKVFGKEIGGTLYTIAKDVKIQVEFNPNIVQAYRLIGYENRLLEDKDFVDDTKDAGELGSGHTVTALYEVIPVGVKSDYLKDISDLKYTKSVVSTNFSDELLTVKFRYKKPDGDKSIEMIHIQKNEVKSPSEDLKFASAVVLFGMQLRESSYYNKTTIKDVITLAKNARGKDKQGYRAEFIRLVSSLN